MNKAKPKAQIIIRESGGDIEGSQKVEKVFSKVINQNPIPQRPKGEFVKTK